MNTLVIPPAQEPVSVAEAKAWLKVEADDAILAGLIATARQAAEDYTGRAFVTQTWELTVDLLTDRRLPDWLPAGTYQLPYNYFDAPLPTAFELPRQPVQSATVTTYAADGTPSPFTGFRLSGNRLVLTGAWPTLRSFAPAEITYVAGYGDPSQVPGPIKTAILLGVQSLYEGRSGASSLTTELGDMPAGVKTLKAGDSTITRSDSGGSSSSSDGISGSALPGSAMNLLRPYRTVRV